MFYVQKMNNFVKININNKSTRLYFMVKVYIIYRKLDASKSTNARVWQNTKYKKNVFYVFLFSEFPKKTGLSGCMGETLHDTFHKRYFIANSKVCTVQYRMVHWGRGGEGLL